MKDINKNFKKISQIYVFKSFRKNLKFKKYKTGLTSFVINRKKYFLRKRKTNFLVKVNISSIWGKNYLKYKQVNRFIQFINITKYTLFFINLNFFKKKFSPKDLTINISTISKKIYYSLPFINFKSLVSKNNSNRFLLVNLNFLEKETLNLGQFSFSSNLYFRNYNIKLTMVYKKIIDILLSLCLYNITQIYKLSIFLIKFKKLL